jgi:hypothetical protein
MPRGRFDAPFPDTHALRVQMEALAASTELHSVRERVECFLEAVRV